MKKQLSLPKKRNLKILGRTASIYRPLFIYSKRRLGIEMHKISWVLEENRDKGGGGVVMDKPSTCLFSAAGDCCWREFQKWHAHIYRC